MIARLRGRVDGLGPQWVVLDVGGVGYLVHCPARVLERLTLGQSAALHVETVVREDAITLYGFQAVAEREWFRLLTTVQGVGARLALGLLGVVTPEQLARAVAAQDKAPLTAASGVGPRLATRIVNELKDKVAEVALSAAGTDLPLDPEATPAAAPVAPATDVPPPADPGPAPAATADAVSALVNLGYGRSEAFAAVAGVTDAATTEDLIRAALKALVPEDRGS